MTATALSQAHRQSAILAAVTMLHAGVIILVASDRLTLLPAFEPLPPVVDLRPQPPEPEPPVRPNMPEPVDYVPETVAMPEDYIPRFTEETAPAGTGNEAGAGAAPSGSATPGGHYQPPALDMRDSRLSALIDACYPSSARRLGNEGRAQVHLVIDAAGRAASWSLEAGTGFSRLDSAVDCVVGRLKFQPARRDGHAVAADVRQTIVFRLN